MLNTLLRVTRNYGTDIYHRFKITRAHNQKVALFLSQKATVNDLLSQIKLHFPINDNLLLVASEFKTSLVG